MIDDQAKPTKDQASCNDSCDWTESHYEHQQQQAASLQRGLSPQGENHVGLVLVPAAVSTLQPPCACRAREMVCAEFLLVCLVCQSAS